MGIDVRTDKSVAFNSTHDKLVITCSSKNPTEMLLKKMRVQSIFKRVMSKTKDGDGNPLIYSLKRMRAFTISSTELKKFVPNFKIILESALKCDPFDMVIPMPSGHAISTILAKRVIRASKHGEMRTDLLRKKNRSEVLAELQIMDVPKKVKSEMTALRKELEKSGASIPFSMKEVKTAALRKYIHPLALATNPVRTAPRVLLVDDLMATGSTLVCARDAILSVFPDAHIEALCLLSGVK